MLRNQATALLRYEHLTTTVPKAKELRPFVERLITIAKRGLANNVSHSGATVPAALKVLNARRLVMHDVQDREVVSKLFDTIAPRFAGRAGGYTRLLRVGFRRGDSAEVAQVELVGSEFDPRAKAGDGKADAAKPAAKGMAGRLRAAAERLRGKGKKESDDRELEDKAAQRAASKGARQKPKKQGEKGS